MAFDLLFFPIISIFVCKSYVQNRRITINKAAYVQVFKDGISVLSVLDARRAKKSGLFPVKIQVIHNRKQKYYSTGKELSKEDWEILAESKSRRLIEIRASVENSFSIIKAKWKPLRNVGTSVSMRSA